MARIEERVYISDENDPGRSVIIPDVKITMQPLWEGVPFEPHGASMTGVAEPIIATTIIEDEIHEARIEIIDRESRVVVTVIEILSPTNKVSGSIGRQSFEAKRQEAMHTSTNWVEVDLLRGGTGVRTRELIPTCEYLAHVSRVGKRPKAYLWPIRLSQRLPVIHVPLKPEDPDAALDLQAVLATAYDRAGYDIDTDYKRDPVPPLSPEWTQWADRLLKAKGLRPA